MAVQVEIRGVLGVDRDLRAQSLQRVRCGRQVRQCPLHVLPFINQQ